MSIPHIVSPTPPPASLTRLSASSASSTPPPASLTRISASSASSASSSSSSAPSVSSAKSLPAPLAARSSVSSTSSLPGPTRVSTARRNLYLHHEAVARSLHGKDTLFREAAARAEHSSHTVARLQERLAALHATQERLSADLSTQRARRVRNKLFKNKAAAVQGSLSARLHALADESASASDAVAHARHVAAAHASECDGLRADAQTLVQAERERRHILEDAFGGMAAGSPRENSLEAERDRLQVVAARHKARLDAHRHAYALLRRAGAELTAARKSLFDAQLTNTVDIFAGGGVGFVAGLGSQYNINEAAKLAQKAGDRIRLAVEINPKLPVMELAKVQNGVALGFADIFLDGFVTDLIIRYTIEKGVKSVEAVLVALKESLRAQKGIVRTLDKRMRDCASELKRTSDDLVRVRAELLHDLVQKPQQSVAPQQSAVQDT